MNADDRRLECGIRNAECGIGSFRIPHSAFYIFGSVLCLLIVSGCVDRARLANVELRKKVQSLEAHVSDLDRRHAGDVATIESLQQGRVTAATLPYEQVERLFTVHGLKLNRLTRADGQGVTVHAVPIDQEGQDLKSAGSLIVEAWQADRTDGPPLAKCEYTLDQARAAWRGQLLMYEYVLQCPWQTMPSGNSIKIRVSFRDALTGREFTAEKLVERKQGE